MNPAKLIELAINARKNAYAPYSKFKVGAALESSDGKVFTGCNVENASFGATCCAERTALVKAVSEGVTKFKQIAIAGNTNSPLAPCGICRQMLAEFAPKLKVIMASTNGKTRTTSLDRLLPLAFRNLK